MSNFRLFHDLDTADDINLSTAPASVASMPLANLLRSGRADRARWLATAIQIDWSWPSGRIVDSVALVRCNLSPAATWRVRLWFDQARTVSVFDSGIQPVYPRLSWGELEWGVDAVGASIFDHWPLKFGVAQFEPSGAICGRIDLDDPANPDGFIDISRLIIGRSFSPEHNSDPITHNWQDDAKQIRTSGGSLHTVSAVEPYRRCALSFSTLSEADRAELAELARRIGGRRDCFVLLWDRATQTRLLRDGALHAKFTTVPGSIHRLRDAFDIPNFVLEEC